MPGTIRTGGISTYGSLHQMGRNYIPFSDLQHLCQVFLRNIACEISMKTMHK